MGFGLVDAMTGGIGGELLDLGTDIWKQDKAEDMQQHSMNFSAAQAAQQMQFQKEMRRTQYQTAVQDMMKAGLNPMLAYHQGGAGTPPGSSGAGAGSQGAPALHRAPTFTSALTAQQIATTQAQQRNIDADTAKKGAEQREIEARTPTHAVNIDRMQQEIRESLQRIDKMEVEMKVGHASAAHLNQQVRNLEAAIPQLQAHTRQLDALTKLNDAQAIERLTASGLNTAQAKEALQRVRQDLPSLARQLQELERTAKQLEQPGRLADEAARGSFLGQMGAYADQLKKVLRLLNPF